MSLIPALVIPTHIASSEKLFQVNPSEPGPWSSLISGRVVLFPPIGRINKFHGPNPRLCDAGCGFGLMIVFSCDRPAGGYLPFADIFIANVAASQQSLIPVFIFYLAIDIAIPDKRIKRLFCRFTAGHIPAISDTDLTDFRRIKAGESNSMTFKHQAVAVDDCCPTMESVRQCTPEHPDGKDENTKENNG